MAREYQERMNSEIGVYKDQENIHELPGIFHYWSNKYLRPMLEEYGVSGPDDFFAKYLLESSIRQGGDTASFVSIGAGNCDTEIRVAGLLKEKGLEKFEIECLEINPHSLERGRQQAEQDGVSDHIVFVEGDFNDWKAKKKYTAVMANQSLHHVVNLEGLFSEVSVALDGGGLFVVSDLIGRNGHQRWPEALEEVHRFWRQLPETHTYNHQLKRYEKLYVNWDCSTEGFEGIRAQDILPLLLSRFQFELFIGFSNIIDIFIDRGFGHNFSVEREWDREFIDKVHAFDEEAICAGRITPTHMMAVLSNEGAEHPEYSRGIRPGSSVRPPGNLRSGMRRMDIRRLKKPLRKIRSFFRR